MATPGIRHAVLWVSDPEVSAAFYEEALGLEIKERVGLGIFLSSPDSATDHDLGLFPSQAQSPGEPGETAGDARSPGLYHIAWEVETLAELVQAKDRLSGMDALVGENNHGVSRSLYCHDPDGIEFEIMWELPLALYDSADPSNVPLDLDADIARWGDSTPGRGGNSDRTT